MFALGASIDLFRRVGMNEIQARALELNRYLTSRLSQAEWNVLSPLKNENDRSAETLVQVSQPADTVKALAEQGVIVTEKPQGIRVATDFFNNESDIDRLLDALASQR
jgi:selenocysteine lyase/cysteine desulfurase